MRDGVVAADSGKTAFIVVVKRLVCLSAKPGGNQMRGVATLLHSGGGYTWYLFAVVVYVRGDRR